MNQALIELKDVSVVYDDKMLLKNVNLSVKRSELIYLTGKVGSGKTSLLKILYAELKLTKGSARVINFLIDGIKTKSIPILRRKLGIVFQDFQLLSDRNVHDNLRFVLEATGWENREDIDFRIIEVLNEVGLIQKEFVHPHELSGGEQQRIVIARALLNKPLIILADEPTGNLDPESSYQVMEILNKIAQSGSCVLIATHQYNLIERYPGRILKIENNSLIEEGDVVTHEFALT
ncbi:MAG: phosphonate ABC transporter ATP-binding protein [Bacteroidetes bacterium]|nr:MAG: phosphonate ABC transporter ATP-binding protein [Bacteroidota bacterium]